MKTEIGILVGEGEYYSPEVNDAVRFIVRKKPEDKDALITKTIPHDTMLLELEPADTSSLATGVYHYCCDITLENGEVYTFIEGKLILGGMKK